MVVFRIWVVIRNVARIILIKDHSKRVRVFSLGISDLKERQKII